MLCQNIISFTYLLTHLVSTASSVVSGEAFVLLADGVEDDGDVLDRARRELVVVHPVSAGGRVEHDVVALQRARFAVLREVVRRAEVVPDLVG